MSAVITIALPVFAIIAAGLLAGRFGILKKDDAGALNRFVFNIAMPAALFGLTARAEALSMADLIFALIYAGAAIIILFGAYGVGRIGLNLAPETAGAHALASSLGNAVFLGLPIALAVPGWAENFVKLMLVEGTLIIALGAAMMSTRGDSALHSFLIRPFKNPLVAAMLAGLAFSLISRPLGFALPHAAATFLDLLGRAAGPTALFSLGLFFATNKAPAIKNIRAHIAAIICLKMLALPALTLGGLYGLGLTDPLVLGPAALFTVTPTGVVVYVIASQDGRYQTEAAAAIAVTTFLSIFTISSVLAIFAS